MLSGRAEVLLSYFTGLAPVGELFEYPRAIVMADCEFRDNNEYYKHLNRLIHGGYVRRIASGRGRSTGVLMVKKRLEHLG